MTRTARPRNSAHLSDSVQQQLNKYALAAGAAGVGVLALAQSAEAKIVYTPTHTSIGPNQTIPLDLNHDGVADFGLTDKYQRSNPYGFDHTGILSVAPAAQANKIAGYTRFGHHYASALLFGVSIGPHAQFTPGAKIMATTFIDTGRAREFSAYCNGPWAKATDRYLGLEFVIGGEPHFGWARLSVRCDYARTRVFAQLTGYAYETVANQPITSGDTIGSDTDEDSSRAPEAAFPAPVPQPAALGALSLGSRGLSLWRREESESAGPAQISA
jgi:hypothetical protein